ncbi:hypothetical protein AAC387_Pa12g0550 [Persea americana]
MTRNGRQSGVGVMEGWKAHGGLAVAQVLFGGYHVLTKVALNVGVNQVVFCAYRDLIAVFILSPFAFLTEKSMCHSISRRLLISFFFLGLTGIFGNQLFFLTGLSYTNPTMAAAMQPAIPVFTILMAAVMGTENINLLRKEGVAKIVGTGICVSGAILMVLYRGPAVIGFGNKDLAVSGLMGFRLERWYIGMLCLIGNCMCMAIYLTLQSSVLKKYPASLSITAYSHLFGSLLMVLTGLFTTDGLTEWILTWSEIVAVLYAGIAASAINFGITTWSNKIIGPTLVALYSPLQPFASAILSMIFLGSSIYLGRLNFGMFWPVAFLGWWCCIFIIGGLLIVAGLYLVTYASYIERQAALTVAYANEASEPLLT